MFERVESSRLVYLAAVSCHKHSLYNSFFKSTNIVMNINDNVIQLIHKLVTQDIKNVFIMIFYQQQDILDGVKMKLP